MESTRTISMGEAANGPLSGSTWGTRDKAAEYGVMVALQPRGGGWQQLGLVQE